MKKIITGIFIGTLVLVVLVLAGRPERGTEAASLLSRSNDALTVEEPARYDFGSISMAAGKVMRQFKVNNTGNKPVNIEKMYTSCMCTSALLIIGEKRFGPVGMPGHTAIPYLNQIMGAGESVIVEVTFDPAAHGPAGVGHIERTVTLENNAGQPVLLRFAATVTP